MRNIVDYGAIADGQTLCTQAIQRALDEASAAGGGTVLVPPGRFRIGTVHLRSHVTMEIQRGGVLVGSEDIADYPPLARWNKPGTNKDIQPHHLLIADDIEHAALCGGGTIDGSGPAFWNPPRGDDPWSFFVEKGQRPSPMIELKNCRDVALRDISVINSPGWTIHLIDSQRIRLLGVNVRNDLLGPNTDGIDITDCQDVFLSDCHIVAGDDAIVLKSYGGVNERILVTNCVCETNCSALKLGASESLGTIRQVTMSNCVVYNSSRGISLFCSAGGTFEDVTFSNIILDCHNRMPLVCPIHIHCCHHPDPTRDRGIGRIRNVRISDVLVRSDARILLTCEDGSMLENIFLSDVHMEYPAVEDRFEQARKAERANQFSAFTPDARAAKACIAAYNVRNLSLRNVTTTWPDQTDVPLAFLWARNIEGGFVDCPLAAPSHPDAPKYDLDNCRLMLQDAPQED